MKVKEEDQEAQQFNYRRESIKVFFGGIGTGLLGFTIGSLLAIRHNRPISRSAITMGLKLTGFGTLFFASRQFILNPILCQLAFSNRASDPISISIVEEDHRDSSPGHFDGLLATSLSAGLVGGSLNGYLRGRSVMLRSGLTTGLVCGTIQVIGNELVRITRAYRRSSKPTTMSITDSSQPPRQQPWWEAWIPLTRIEDEEWRMRLIDQLSNLDHHQATLDHQISQLLLAIDQRHDPSKPSPSSSSPT